MDLIKALNILGRITFLKSFTYQQADTSDKPKSEDVPSSVKIQATRVVTEQICLPSLRYFDAFSRTNGMKERVLNFLVFLVWPLRQY
jgi:hypothetical protein